MKKNVRVNRGNRSDDDNSFNVKFNLVYFYIFFLPDFSYSLFLLSYTIHLFDEVFLLEIIEMCK